MQSHHSIKEKIAFIQQYPIFCLLSDEDLNELAQISIEKVFQQGDVITQEDDIIDKVYLIIEGQGDVYKNILSENKSKLVKVAILTANDAIGINESGFFSSTLFRTAMVKAATVMRVLEINIIDFQKFLSSPSVLYPALKTVSEKILFMHFMKISGLLKKFSQEQIQAIANKTTKLHVSKNTVLFKQGDFADKIYFLTQGNVEIIGTDNEEEHILTVIESPKIFGESAFFSEGRRNATARTGTDCTFFVLEVNAIKEILDKQSADALYDALGGIRIKQLRPQKTGKEVRTDNLLVIQDKSGVEHKLTVKEMAVYRAIKTNDTIADLLKKPELKEYNFSLHDLYDEILKLHQMAIINLPFEDLKGNKHSFNKITQYFKKLFWK